MDEAVVCPGCGCPVAANPYNYNPYAAPVMPAESKKAKTSMILGIIGLILLSPLLAIPAIIFAVNSKEETGRVMCGKAQAGLICGIIALVLWALVLILYIAMIGAML